MRALIHAAVVAALVTGCADKSGTSLVVVSVDADGALSDVATLHARATVGTVTREFDVHPTSGGAVSIPPAQTFGINLPRAMTGELDVHVEAHDSNGNVSASGDGGGAIRVGGRADVSVHLVATTSSDGDMAAPASDMGMSADLMPTGDMVVIPPAMLTIDKTSQAFGDITVGKTSTTASFLIVNAGGMDSGVPMLTTGGANVAEFTISTDCGTALAPNGRCHVTASVAPTSAGMKQATFTLKATPGGDVSGTLTANALTPGAVKIVQPSGDCGSSLVGVQSTTTATFTVQNTGASPTGTLSVMTSDPQFTPTGCNGTTLAAGAMCTVTVKFKPSTAGTQNASLSVSASPGGTDAASLVGVGLKPASLRLSPTTYTFATVPRNSGSETAVFTIYNDGDVDSPTIPAAVLAGTNPSSFTLTDHCMGAPLGPSPAHCTINVLFAPKSSGANSASFSVSTSGQPTLTASLSGSGTPIWVREGNGTANALNAIWGSDASHVWAVGDAATALFSNSNGSWAAQTVDYGAQAVPDFHAVWGSGPFDIWAGGTALYRSTGDGTFSSFPLPNQSGWITSIWGTSAADVWVANAGNVLHWTTLWESETVDSGAQYLWGSSTGNIYAAGSSITCGLGSCSSQAVVYHRDAANMWTLQYHGNGLPGPVTTLAGLWGSGPTDIFAGSTARPLHSTGNGAWSPVDPAAPKNVAAIWGTGPTDVWFVGVAGINHYDGSATGAAYAPSSLNASGVWGTTDGAHVYVIGKDSVGNCIYHRY